VADDVNIELVDAPIEVLRNLMQLYDYDFAEFTGRVIGDDGRYRIADYSAERFHRNLVRVDGELAGFTIVGRDEGTIDPTEQVWWVAEFFVLRKFRRSGVGEQVARMLFDARPGTWEVGQLRSNTAAQAFWRKVIDRYTDGHYEEHDMTGEPWDGSIQLFRR
jgi:predicted acetyltransferase